MTCGRARLRSLHLANPTQSDKSRHPSRARCASEQLNLNSFISSDVSRRDFLPGSSTSLNAPSSTALRVRVPERRGRRAWVYPKPEGSAVDDIHDRSKSRGDGELPA